jgi:hypothetical protein
MNLVLKLFWNICLLRAGPELVPTQGWFIGALVGAWLLVSVLGLLVAYPAMAAMLALNIALIGLAATAGIVWFALHVRQFEGRFPATLGAIVGAKALIGALLVIAYAVASGFVLQSLSYALLIWSVVVVGAILQRALACPLWLGLLISAASTAIGWVINAATLGRAIAAAAGGTTG